MSWCTTVILVRYLATLLSSRTATCGPPARIPSVFLGALAATCEANKRDGVFLLQAHRAMRPTPRLLSSQQSGGRRIGC